MNTVNELMNKRIHRCFCFYTAILFVRISREIERERERIQRELSQKWFTQIHSAQRTQEKCKQKASYGEWMMGFESNPNDELTGAELKWKNAFSLGNEPYHFCSLKRASAQSQCLHHRNNEILVEKCVNTADGSPWFKDVHTRKKSPWLADPKSWRAKR